MFNRWDARERSASWWAAPASSSCGWARSPLGQSARTTRPHCCHRRQPSGARARASPARAPIRRRACRATTAACTPDCAHPVPRSATLAGSPSRAATCSLSTRSDKLSIVVWPLTLYGPTIRIYSAHIIVINTSTVVLDVGLFYFTNLFTNKL